MTVRRALAASAVAAFALQSCAASLPPPPPLEQVGRPELRATSPAGDPAATLTEAERLLAGRSDAGAVERARIAFLEAAKSEEAGVAALLGAAVADAWLIQHERSPERRAELATESVQVAQWCLRRAPRDPACDYRLAIALGLQARERPATAADALPRIVALLESVVDRAPGLDEGGPFRVLALLRLRAPAWPIGPGDPEAALDDARAAVAQAPEAPLNHLVLCEALAATSSVREARVSCEAGRALAQARLDRGDPDAADALAEADRLEAALH